MRVTRISIDTKSNQNTFPVTTFVLLGLFYGIGLVYLDLSRFDTPLNYRMDTFIVDIDTFVDKYALKSDFQWQWQIFSYYLVHFAIVHYGYSGLLMMYYMQGAERAYGWKIVLACFLLTSILAPILLGPVIYLIWLHIPGVQNFFFVQSYYLGSSVGVWGCMGLSAEVSRRRRFFWVGIFLMLVPEFFLKIAAGSGDIMANVIHILVFTINWIVVRRVCDIANNDLKSGALTLSSTHNRLMVILATLHSVTLVIHFIDVIGIFEHTILAYLF